MNDSALRHVDALVVGGGIAGSCTAAALAKRGMRVLLCESGLPSEKRLAGELMHPPAAEDLDELDLLEPLVAQGAAPVYGFAVFRGPEDRGTLLSYSEVTGGRASSIAMEHAAMTRALLQEVRTREGVTVEDARVIEITKTGATSLVRLQRGDTQECISASLVVLADGRDSKLGKSLGFEVRRGEDFQMVGWRVPNGRLPWPGYAHVFVHEGATTLAYQISRTDVRVMFELSAGEHFDLEKRIAMLPRAFREDVARAVVSEPKLSAKVFAVTPNEVSRGAVCLVGDAGGCVHPLTASGIAFCTRDATELAHAIHARPSIVEALTHYEAERRGPMRARATLGPALVEALTSSAPEMRVLRHGLFRYWATSARGRRSSIGLLSTQELRTSVVVREYASVCLHSLRAITEGAVPRDAVLPALVSVMKRARKGVRTWMAGADAQRHA